MIVETLWHVLIGLALIGLPAVALICYVAWRSNRRMDDAAAEMARQSSGGGGGPKEQP
jgi:hypothetical protein